MKFTGKYRSYEDTTLHSQNIQAHVEAIMKSIKKRDLEENDKLNDLCPMPAEDWVTSIFDTDHADRLKPFLAIVKAESKALGYETIHDGDDLVFKSPLGSIRYVKNFDYSDSGIDFSDSDGVTISAAKTCIVELNESEVG